jgi:hypothetical protein
MEFGVFCAHSEEGLGGWEVIFGEGRSRGGFIGLRKLREWAVLLIYE